jgi:hypothetical protein
VNAILEIIVTNFADIQYTCLKLTVGPELRCDEWKGPYRADPKATMKLRNYIYSIFFNFKISTTVNRMQKLLGEKSEREMMDTK